MDVRLYTIPGSHPGIAVAKMLESKGLGYDRIDLIPVIAKVFLRLAGFPGTTVPALKIGDQTVQGSMKISRALDSVAPEPPLYPSDPGHRIAVEQIERFADQGLQHPVRQILWWALKRERSAMLSFAQGSDLGVPIGLAMKTSAPLVEMTVRFNGARDKNVRDALAGLPGILNRIDDWIAEGVLGGPEPNAADYQVAASLRLAMTLEDLREPIARHPAGQLALRILPEYPGHVPSVIPEAWLEPLRATSDTLTGPE